MAGPPSLEEDDGGLAQQIAELIAQRLGQVAVDLCTTTHQIPVTPHGL